MAILPSIKSRFRNISYRLFPALRFRRAEKAIDPQEKVENFESGLEEGIDEYSGDIDLLLSRVEEAYWSELDRSSKLDSKAGNYLGNIGVVLSILSLAPVLSVVLGFSGGNIISGTWLDIVALLIFGYAVFSLLFSAYYSTKALKMRGYTVYYAADGIKSRILRDGVDDEEMIYDLLKSKRENEVNNLEKNNAISVAESFTLNGLMGLGIGMALVVIIHLPIGSIFQMVQAFIC